MEQTQKQKDRIRKIIAFKLMISDAKPEALELLKELCLADYSNWAMNAHEMSYRAGKKDVWRDIVRLKEIPLDELESENV